MSSKHFVIMGISGSGKTTVAINLQQHLKCHYAEGDDFHTQANRDKMGAGIPLNDDDRQPWLENLRDWMTQETQQGEMYSIVTCSALKKAYRDTLRQADGEVYFIHLAPPIDINIQRMLDRKGHYMKANMIESQLAILEALEPEEKGILINHPGTPEEVWQEIFQWIQTL